MRVASYRDDVLWAIAYKLGLDPAREFLVDQGESLASYINAWTRRAWDSADFPEWATIKEFRPDVNHMVLWRAFPLGAQEPVVLSRPLKVYLVDPRLSPYPMDIHFREWDEGLHVGFEHGDTVFIKYLGTAPKFTSLKWDPNRSYASGEAVYSPSSGECYRSLVANNLGNDPVVGFLASLPTGLIQFALPPSPGVNEQKKIMDAFAIQDPPPAGPGPPTPYIPPVGTVFRLTVKDTTLTTTLGDVTYTVKAGDTYNEIMNGLAASLTAAPGMAGFTITATPSQQQLRLVNNSDFKISQWTWMLPAGSTLTYLRRAQVQAYIAAIPSAPGQAQISQLIISNDQVKGCTTYTLTFRDAEGDVHTASYYAAAGEGLLQIITGLAAEIAGSSDPWFNSIGVSVEPNLGSMEFSTMGGVSLDASMEPDSSAYWDRILFPYALIEPVVRGAYSDALREAGQTDKGQAEEQGAVQEGADRMQKALAPAYDILTDQQRAAPRYRTRPGAAGAAK